MYTEKKNRLKIIINAINIPTHHTTLFIRIYVCIRNGRLWMPAGMMVNGINDS